MPISDEAIKYSHIWSSNKIVYYLLYNTCHFKLFINCMFFHSELWHKENSVLQEISSLKTELNREDNALRSKVGRAILNGHDSVHKILNLFTNKGGDFGELTQYYYGPVIELFSCNENVYTAIEVIAGNRLFHHIVETDTVGTKILIEMNQQKLTGEVTFMPLNRLDVRNVQLPQDEVHIQFIIEK